MEIVEMLWALENTYKRLDSARGLTSAARSLIIQHLAKKAIGLAMENVIQSRAYPINDLDIEGYARWVNRYVSNGGILDYGVVDKVRE